ncbi:hypothetical protein GCM10027062_25730 [Nocardioides hungaricus]
MTRCLALLVAITAFLVPVGVPTAEAAPPDNFQPKPGVTFNNPTGDRDKRRQIYRKIIRSINSAPGGSTIKFFTWNFLTSEGADALLRAQRRGVTVRLLMDASNNRDEIGNPPFRRLRAGLHQRNLERPKRPRSWAKTCQGSCRGSGGVAHAKFFMFSQVGKVPRVVVQGSANFTLASTNNQWNDVVTHTRSKPVWRFYDKIFRQAARDKKLEKPFAAGHFGDFSLYQYPLVRTPVDPVYRLLNRIKCRGATNTASGRTVIRMAPDVIRNARGMKFARKIRSLWDAGCDIRIGYTVMGIEIGRYLRSPKGRGPVPMKHLVQDFDGDGQFDNYFHIKAMAIIGNVNGDRSSKVVVNGSANLSGLGRVSDENVGIYRRGPLTDRYREHLDYWYENFPKDQATDGVPNGNARRAPTEDMLVFGSGKNAVYEDGTPYSTTGINPYAKLDLTD